MRKNIQTLWNANSSDPIITTYKNAVQQMKALPSSNPLSWEFQAQIHNNSCIHRNWLWLPWHRAYLSYFERICRKLTGDNNFALPYWNWNTRPAVPDPFWDTSSSLFDSNRGVTQSDQADSSYIGTSVLNGILSEPSFELFASARPLAGQNLHFPIHGEPTEGLLEGTPHDHIHGFVGGDMGAFISPRDPVFYTHHCMVDCMWNHWNVDLGNANTNDSGWMNFAFNDFFDENGNSVSVTVAVTLLMPLFAYQYEPCTIGGPLGMKKGSLSREQLKEFLSTGAPTKLEYKQRFEVRQAVTTEVGKAAGAAIKAEVGVLREAIQENSRSRVVLTVGDVDMPEKRDFFVRVFVNKPDASAATGIDDPHYAGSFTFFFDEEAMKHHAPELAQAGGDMRPKNGFLVDVTPVLQRLSQGGALAGETAVSLVPVPFAHRESMGHLTLQRLELAVVSF